VKRYPIRSRARGFSLVELLVVTSIIAMLVAIVAPSLRRAMELTKRATCMAGLKVIADGFHQYGMENKRFLPPAPPVSDEGISIWTIWDGTNYFGAGLMVELGYVSSPKALYCPSWSNSKYEYGSSTGWPKSGDPAAESQATTGYSYHYRASFDGSEMDMAGKPKYRTANMDTDPSDEVIMSDGFTMLGSKPAVKYHHREGYNVLRLDKSGKFLHDTTNAIADEELGETAWSDFETDIWSGYFKNGLPGS